MNPPPGAARTGILGGTLDPIHLGHIETAVAARRTLGLERVIVMPSRVPPHRQQGPSASSFHRFAMAALAVNAIDGLEVSDEELRSEGPSYTALTLERLAGRGLPAQQLFFITGADAFVEIGTWYRYPEVLDMARFAVVSRPGVPVASLPARLPHLADRFVKLPAGLPGLAGDEGAIILIDAPTPDVSSSAIRQRLRDGLGVRGLVPPSVESHIARHALYTAHSPSHAEGCP
jgi:nicotinate-nucleotide adenylyltransferase